MKRIHNLPDVLPREQSSLHQLPASRFANRDFQSDEAFPVAITRAASKQTYYTVRFLVDRDRIAHAYRAYAYFRWLDDCLDLKLSEKSERIAFAQHQQTLIDCGYQGDWPSDLSAEERILADLIQGDLEQDSGLQSYIRHMMAVMAFDAERRGRLISEEELAVYTSHLAIAVTEALHYFIGHDQPPPVSKARYLPATGAHIIHMLRDTLEDAAAGYFNIPCEFLQANGLHPCDVESACYKAWVQGRVKLARACFAAGEKYLAQVPNRRCRIAGYAYMARFRGVLDAIEREGYQIRPDYHERKRLGAGLKMGESVIADYLRSCAV